MQFSRRKLLTHGCALGAATGFPWTGFAQTKSHRELAGPSVDPMSYVNPEFWPALQKIESAMGPMPVFSLSTLPSLRKMGAQWAGTILPSPAITQRMIPGVKGSPEVPVYVTGASPGASKPAVLHIHGGGYVSGSAASDGRNLQELVLAHDCVTVSVDYRLAPETPFPGSLNDNYAALKWMHANAESLGVDTNRIAIKGESAGGGHAAALAIAARDRGEVPICFQVLIYPMLDDRTGATHQLPVQFGKYLWTAASNRFGWSSLLGVPAGSSSVRKGAVPARVEDLSRLPPAFIGVGSIDLFAPEDIRYAERLMLAGVPTELQVVPGGFHGFDGIAADAPLSDAFTKAWNEALKRAFTKTTPS